MAETLGYALLDAGYLEAGGFLLETSAYVNAIAAFATSYYTSHDQQRRAQNAARQAAEESIKDRYLMTRSAIQPRLCQIHPAQNVGVLWLQRVHEIVHAGADLPLQIDTCGRQRAEFFCQPGQRIAFDAHTTMAVDDGVSQQSIAPGQCALVLAHGVAFFDTLDERILQNLGGQLSTADARLQKSEQPLPVGNQGPQRFWGKS